MEFLDGSWKKEVSSWDALMGEELLNQEAILEGAIHSIRNMGDVAFVIIRRREGLFQTVFVNEFPHKLPELLCRHKAVKSFNCLIILDDFKRDILFPINWRVITAVPKILIFLISFPFPG